MMSQNSSKTDRGHTFFGQLVRNGRQRLWLLAINSAALLLYFPLQFLAVFSSAENKLRDTGNLTAVTLAQEQFLEGISYGNIIFFGVMASAVIAALSGFSYLYDRSKVDFYHSQPVSARERFAFTYLTGLLYFMLPLFVFSGLMLYSGSVYGIVEGELLSSAILLILMMLLYYFAVYHLAILAICLTGNYIAGICGIFALLGTEWSIRRLTFEYAKEYFHTFSEFSKETFLSCRLSCANIYLEAVRKVKAMMVVTENMGDEKILLFSDVSSLLGSYLIRLFVIGLILLAAALFFYIRRDAGTAGVAVCNRLVGFFAILTGSFLAGITLGWLIGRLSGRDAAILATFGILAGAVFAYLIISMIVQRRPGDIFRNLWILALSVAFSCVFFLCFEKDLTGFDKSFPKREQIAGTAVLFEPHLLEIGWYSGEKDLMEQMQLNDVDALLSLSGTDFYHRDISDQREEELWLQTPFTVCYKMKGGGRKYRCYYTDFTEHADLMDRLIGDAGYLETIFPVMTQTNTLRGNAMVSFTSSLSNYSIEKEDGEGLLQALREDLQKLDYTTMRDEREMGLVNYYSRSGPVEGSKDYPVYESFDNVLTFLQEKGYLESRDSCIPKAEDFTDLEINLEGDGGYDEQTLYFHDPAEVQSILSACEPVTFGTDWKDPRSFYRGISIYAQNPGGGYVYYKVRSDVPLPPELEGYEQDDMESY